jgi:protein SCO1/2
MNKKAILALMLAILLPLTGYLIVKYFSKDAVQMPPRYFYDSVAVNTDRGKTTTDTLWHTVRDIHFTNQLGKQVSLYDLHGRVVVIDLFFTRCGTICPGMAKAMKRLQDSFKKNDSIVQFISISVDPEHDSVPQLRKFADRFNVNHDTWWMVTGDKKDIYDFAMHELKAGLADTEVDSAFIHTSKMFLLDSTHIVRGFYDGLDSDRQARLVRDVPLLMLERNKKAPSVFRDFIPILPLIFVGIGIIVVMAIVFTRKKIADG